MSFGFEVGVSVRLWVRPYPRCRLGLDIEWGRHLTAIRVRVRVVVGVGVRVRVRVISGRVLDQSQG